MGRPTNRFRTPYTTNFSRFPRRRFICPAFQVQVAFELGAAGGGLVAPQADRPALQLVDRFVEQEGHQLADRHALLLCQVLQALFQIHREVEIDPVGFALLSSLALLLLAGSLVSRQACFILATLSLAKQRLNGRVHAGQIRQNWSTLSCVVFHSHSFTRSKTCRYPPTRRLPCS